MLVALKAIGKYTAFARSMVLILLPILVFTTSFARIQDGNQEAIGMSTYQTFQQECTYRASLLKGKVYLESLPQHITIKDLLPESWVKVYTSKKKLYNGVCRYDKWWLTSHLRASQPKHFLGHFESVKGATYSCLPIEPSKSFGVSWLQEPLIHAPYKKTRVSTGYWRHSERYFSLISSILALLSGLLINSVT